MITQKVASSRPTGASDILLALEHLPSEDDLAYALRSARHLILNRGRWQLIEQDDLPNIASPHVLRLGRLSTLVPKRKTNAVAEALTEAVRELLVQQDVRTRYVHELDKEELLELTNLSVRLNMKVDTASEYLKRVFAPELVRRGMKDEALLVAQKLFWRIAAEWVWSSGHIHQDAAEWVWSSGHIPKELLDSNSMDKDEVYKGFLRALQTARQAANCDNRTLMGDVTRERAANIISLAVWEDDGFDLELLRDAVALAKESTELDSNPDLNILQEGHQDLCERFDCSGWLWRWRSRNCRDYTVTHLKRFIELSEKRAGHSGSDIRSLRRLRIWFDRDPDLLVAMLQVR